MKRLAEIRALVEEFKTTWPVEMALRDLLVEYDKLNIQLFTMMGFTLLPDGTMRPPDMGQAQGDTE